MPIKQINIIYLIESSVPYGANVALINLIDEILEYNRYQKDFFYNIQVIAAVDGDFITWLRMREIKYKIIPYRFNIKPSLTSLKDKILSPTKYLYTKLLNTQAEKKLYHYLNNQNLNPENTIIHTNIGPIDIGFKVAKRSHYKHVWHLREYQDKDFNLKFNPDKDAFESQLNMSNVITITKDIFEYFKLGKSSTFIHKNIYDGVLGESDIKVDIPKDKKNNFLYVGRIERAKGFELLVDAVKILKDRNIELVIDVSGTGLSDYMRYVNNIIAENGLNNYFNFLGFRKDRLDLMYKAKALLVPSLFEGFGFITVEAMFNNCLVIGNNTGGTKEILNQPCGDLGLLFNSSAEDLAEKIILVNNNKTGLNMNDLLIKAREFAKVNYSKERNFVEINSLYKDLLLKI